MVQVIAILKKNLKFLSGLVMDMWILKQLGDCVV